MAKAVKPKNAAKDKPPARKRRTKAPIDHVLGKPEVMETAALNEAEELILKIGEDFDAMLERSILSLCRKHKVNETFVNVAVSQALLRKAVELTTSALILKKQGGSASDD